MGYPQRLCSDILARICTRYKKKAVVFVMRDPKNMHEYQTRAIEYGAEMHWVPNGMLSVTEKEEIMLQRILIRDPFYQSALIILPFLTASKS